MNKLLTGITGVLAVLAVSVSGNAALNTGTGTGNVVQMEQVSASRNVSNSRNSVKDKGEIHMKTTNKETFDKENVFGTGVPNDGYAKYFIGNSYLNPLVTRNQSEVTLTNVTFEPGCRNNWHIHHATRGGGQILVCTAGEGWYQEEGKPAQELKPGSVVMIPAGVKHWHGAKKDSWFSHISIEVPGENTSNEWLEPVTDEQYNALKEG